MARDKAARRKHAHAYYLANREKYLAYGKAYRDAHKEKLATVTIGRQALELLRNLAEEDGISMGAEARRLVYREHAIRTLARSSGLCRAGGLTPGPAGEAQEATAKAMTTWKTRPWR